MAISNKKLLEAIETITTFCKEQSCCQNCILRSFGADSWNCCVDTFELSEVMANIEAKKKNKRYI